MIAKILIYVYYDHLEYENILNVWLETGFGESTMPYRDSNDVDEVINSICKQIREESTNDDIDLYVVNEADDLSVDFYERFVDKGLQPLNTSKSTWTRDKVKKVIQDNFNKKFQDIHTEKIEHGDTPKKNDEKIPLSRLMIEIAKGEIY